MKNKFKAILNILISPEFFVMTSKHYHNRIEYDYKTNVNNDNRKTFWIFLQDYLKNKINI